MGNIKKGPETTTQQVYGKWKAFYPRHIEISASQQGKEFVMSQITRLAEETTGYKILLSKQTENTFEMLL